MLILVATPIGNLKDITHRALEALETADYILCEDTRRTAILLNAYNIKNTLKSFHKFSEKKKEDPVIADLKLGKTVALVSDAGSPGIADPGSALVRRCREEGICVETRAGPSAVIAALSGSGLPTHRFQFVGFLPKKSGQLKKMLEEILDYPGTTVCYESPFRLVKVLGVLKELDPARQVAVGRELSKKFEETYLGTAEEVFHYFEKKGVKGEIVLMIS